MKTIIISLLAILLPLHLWAEQPRDIFRTNDLVALDLVNIGAFWDSDTPEIRIHRSNANFQREATFVGGLKYADKNKHIDVAVFKSEIDAVNAMEALRASVASVIVPGDSVTFNGLKWWHTSGIPNGVFVAYQNTVITVACYQPPYDESKGLLQETAITIVDRIKRHISIQQAGPAYPPQGVGSADP